MLSRTADNLFWLSRYTERADFVARILDAAMRLSSLPSSYGGERNEWEGAVAAAGNLAEFKRLYGAVNEDTVRDFLAFSPNNPSSIKRSIEAARENARSVRTALTVEMWDAINGAWLELKRFDNSMSREEFARFLDWVKGVSLAFDGSAYRTMLRTTPTGSRGSASRSSGRQHGRDPRRQVSRAAARDREGRRQPRLLPVDHDSARGVGADRVSLGLSREHQAAARRRPPHPEPPVAALARQLLRASGAPSRPRAEAYGRRGPSQRLASAMQARLSSTRIETVFASGLHEFITDFIVENNEVGSAIVEQYLS
jgi:uncharacterized alpha-E superfamily protein